MDLSIIILTYNSSSYIENLLSSILSKYKTAILEKKLEIIIADNDSKDDTVKLAKKYKEARIIETGGNYGYAKGNNIAAKKASGRVILFLNPDAVISDGDIFDLVSEFEDETVGVVGGKIYSYDKTRELSCGKFYNFWNTLLLSIGLEEKLGVRFAPHKKTEVDFVSGAFLAIKKELFEKLEGFDEHYFMYIEDSDLCFRVKQNGYKVIFSPKASITHVGQGSSNRTFAVVNIYKGILYFNKKRIGTLSYLISLMLLKTKAFVLVIVGKIINNRYLTDTYSRALKA